MIISISDGKHNQSYNIEGKASLNDLREQIMVNKLKNDADCIDWLQHESRWYYCVSQLSEYKSVWAN